MNLFFRKLGSGHPIIILHGVFGSSDNWQTIGKQLAEHFLVYLVDLRNHGNSSHHPDFNYEVMAKDVLELIANENIPSTHLIGHSMGGKIAMHIALHHGGKINKLCVVDIAPKYYPPHHQDIFEGFKAVQLSTLTQRKEADLQLTSVIQHPVTRQFILKNLHRRSDGTFAWKLNIQAIEDNQEEIGNSPNYSTSFDGGVLFIRGTLSEYILQEDYELIYRVFPKASIVPVERASHWVHAEKPEEVLALLRRFLI